MTVLSPLVETAQWLDDVRRKVQSVDVETYFIMQELSAALRVESCKTQVFPGLFISDEVGGEHPLTEKIDPANAWVELPRLLKQSLTHFKVTDRRPPVVEIDDDSTKEEQVVPVPKTPPPTESRWDWSTIGKAAVFGALMFAGGFLIGKALRK